MLDVISVATNYFVVTVLIIITYSLIKVVKKEAKNDCCEGKEVCSCNKNETNCSCKDPVNT
ncbi:hypothetical protein AWH56_004255 [Anaerobacillus isosaccharinicus]|uniref:Uncharacterized protein n=1 Tax=Anaerobacillus isosaccharinicus TaxID=1532552 RepID=A0A1S2KXF4_9BACI|nr:hypothetical protein [Anaerobacillus isosaccharinicus]MBA5584761.1 hypothetical protein [Anaerobacillus isosaccharinicus]QOY36872.1 hypothetical protein AWH56_004255 [Anaerobacillus isosaccharinicus]